jgi:hypothetical protein
MRAIRTFAIDEVTQKSAEDAAPPMTGRYPYRLDMPTVNAINHSGDTNNHAGLYSHYPSCRRQ